ncbi:hypothetical protein GF389_05900 [Candidatus Dojkabacteria bacterium]|nr:hypothetical protein [Candidatus Dojkabacteria bacterium]
MVKVFSDGNIYYASQANNGNSTAKHFGNLMFLEYEGRAPLIYNTRYQQDVASTSTNLTYRQSMSAQVGEYTKKTTGDYTFESEAINSNENVTDLYGFIDYDIYTIWDECDDSSINATNFPTSTNCSEGANGITINQDGELRTKDLSSNAVIVLRGKLYGRANSSSRFTLIDSTASNESWVVIGAGEFSQGNYTNAKIYYFETVIWNDWANNVVYTTTSFFHHTSGNMSPGPHSDRYYGKKHLKHDVTSFDELRIRIQTPETNGTCYAYLDWIRLPNTNPSTTATMSISANDGSDYTESTNGTVTRCTAGSTMKLKLTGTVASGEVVSVMGIAMGSVK